MRIQFYASAGSILRKIRERSKYQRDQMMHPNFTFAPNTGQTHLYGKEVYKWNKKGLQVINSQLQGTLPFKYKNEHASFYEQANLYYTTADEEQLPVELYQVISRAGSMDTEASFVHLCFCSPCQS